MDVQEKWWKFLTVFLDGISNKGDFLHLPCSGGTLDQPCKTMQVFRVMRSVYQAEINKQVEAAKRG